MISSESETILQRSYWFLGSRELALLLFLTLSIFLIPGTFAEKENINLGWPASIIFGLMGLNLLFCTMLRIKTLSKPVIVLHAGILIVLAGVVLGPSGYVATVNIYEGTSVDSAYRWDLGQDAPLGFSLAVKKIEIEYYPFPVKVGVLRGTEKVGLFELKTGESFVLDRYNVSPENISLPAEILGLNIFEGNTLIGSADTAGARRLPQDFPFDFVLVAYKTPRIKRIKVDLELSKDGQVVSQGTTEVNSPLTWGKQSFYNTKIESDKFGIRFAGIQITKDPGRPYVFLGFTVMGIGSLMYLMRKVLGKR